MNNEVINVIVNDINKQDAKNVEPSFFDYHKSWLEFNERVLNEGSRSINPILERLNFIGIADSNLDEFIRTKFDGRKEIKKLITEQTKRIEDLYISTLDELRQEYKINITTIDELEKDFDKKEEFISVYKSIKDYFVKNVYPICQPLILANELPMPNMSDGAAFVIVKLDNGVSCVIKIPDTQLIEIKTHNEYKTFILIEDIIERFISEFYRGNKIINMTQLRVLRKIDSLCADDSDYIKGIKNQIKNRDIASIQMVDINSDLSEYQGLFNSKVKKRKRTYVYGLSFLKNIKNIVPYTDDMVYNKVKPRTPTGFVGESIFDILTEEDIIVHYPYESFKLSAVKFIEEAADDDNVIAIKQTLYRVDDDSPLVNALIKAANNGKQVIVLLELKAKMDEKNNLELTEKLKNAGCNIIFGPIRMKTHAKISLVIRQEGNKIAKYVNISTGNFNNKTAKIYEDVSYFTKERKKFKVGTDLSDLFNYLGGCSEISKTNDLLISPKTFRPRIETEIDNCIKSKVLHPDKDVVIRMKCNAFTDKKMATKLYDASNAGVKVKLIIRGMCIIKPGVEGMSENIEVISIIGRYLEHSRIYEFNYFDDESKLITHSYIGSGDMMPRNLDYRVEVVTQLKTAPIKDQISAILDSYFLDNVHSYKLLSTGKYIYPNTDNLQDEMKISVQDTFISYYKELEKNIIR